ncbi:MAG: hypothetical protein R2698_04245 [Microthrixaceae bacterium]
MAVAAAVGAWYLPAVISVGLRTDVGAHLKFAEDIGYSGTVRIPYALFEQLVIIVRTLIPFGALERISPVLGSRSATWAATGVIVVIIAVMVCSDLVLMRMYSTMDGPPSRFDPLFPVIATVAAMIVSPATFMTWASHNLVLGYISITSYENPTTNLVRPLVLLITIEFARRSSQSTSRRSTSLLALATLLSAFAKPSFLLPFIPATLLYGVVTSFRRKRFNWQVWCLGLFLPALVAAVWQTAVAASLSGRLTVAPLRSLRILMALHHRPAIFFVATVVASTLFPLVAAVFLGREMRWRRSLVLGWLTYGFGLVLFLMLSIVDRPDNGDLIWGPQLALLVVVVESLVAAYPVLSKRIRTGTYRFGIGVGGWVVVLSLLAQVVSGLFLHHQETFHPAAWW